MVVGGTARARRGRIVAVGGMVAAAAAAAGVGGGRGEAAGAAEAVAAAGVEEGIMAEAAVEARVGARVVEEAGAVVAAVGLAGLLVVAVVVAAAARAKHGYRRAQPWILKSKTEKKHKQSTPGLILSSTFLPFLLLLVLQCRPAAVFTTLMISHCGGTSATTRVSCALSHYFTSSCPIHYHLSVDWPLVMHALPVPPSLYTPPRLSTSE